MDGDKKERIIGYIYTQIKDIQEIIHGKIENALTHQNEINTDTRTQLQQLDKRVKLLEDIINHLPADSVGALRADIEKIKAYLTEKVEPLVGYTDDVKQWASNKDAVIESVGKINDIDKRLDYVEYILTHLPTGSNADISVRLAQLEKYIDESVKPIVSKGKTITWMDDNIASVKSSVTWVQEMINMGYKPEDIKQQYEYVQDIKDVEKLNAFVKAGGLGQVQDANIETKTFTGDELYTYLTNIDFLEANKILDKNHALGIGEGLLIVPVNRNELTPSGDILICDYASISARVQIFRASHGNKIHVTTTSLVTKEKIVDWTGEVDEIQGTRKAYDFINPLSYIFQYDLVDNKDYNISITGLRVNVQELKVKFTKTQMAKVPQARIFPVITKIPPGMTFISTGFLTKRTTGTDHSQIFKLWAATRINDLTRLIMTTFNQMFQDDITKNLYGQASAVTLSYLSNHMQDTVRQVDSVIRFTSKDGIAYSMYPMDETLPHYDVSYKHRNRMPILQDYMHYTDSARDTVDGGKTRRYRPYLLKFNESEYPSVNNYLSNGATCSTGFSRAGYRNAVKRMKFEKTRNDGAVMQLDAYVEIISNMDKLSSARDGWNGFTVDDKTNTYTELGPIDVAPYALYYNSSIEVWAALFTIHTNDNGNKDIKIIHGARITCDNDWKVRIIIESPDVVDIGPNNFPGAVTFVGPDGKDHEITATFVRQAIDVGGRDVVAYIATIDSGTIRNQVVYVGTTLEGKLPAAGNHSAYSRLQSVRTSNTGFLRDIGDINYSTKDTASYTGSNGVFSIADNPWPYRDISSSLVLMSDNYLCSFSDPLTFSNQLFLPDTKLLADVILLDTKLDSYATNQKWRILPGTNGLYIQSRPPEAEKYYNRYTMVLILEPRAKSPDTLKLKNFTPIPSYHAVVVRSNNFEARETELLLYDHKQANGLPVTERQKTTVNLIKHQVTKPFPSLGGKLEAIPAGPPKVYRVKSVELRLKETVLPNSALDQSNITERIVGTQTAIKYLQENAAYMQQWMERTDLRISRIEDTITVLVQSMGLNGPDSGLQTAETIISAIGGFVGMFFPIVGGAISIIGATLGAAVTMAKGDMVGGCLELMMASALAAIDAYKFNKRLKDKYGAKAITSSKDHPHFLDEGKPLQSIGASVSSTDLSSSISGRTSLTSLSDTSSMSSGIIGTTSITSVKPDSVSTTTSIYHTGGRRSSSTSSISSDSGISDGRSMSIRSDSSFTWHKVGEATYQPVYQNSKVVAVIRRQNKEIREFQLTPKLLQQLIARELQIKEFAMSNVAYLNSKKWPSQNNFGFDTEILDGILATIGVKIPAKPKLREQVTRAGEYDWQLEFEDASPEDDMDMTELDFDEVSTGIITTALKMDTINTTALDAMLTRILHS